MQKQYYFLSGLPRSGSTLLASILAQNPDVYANITSTLKNLVDAVLNHSYDLSYDVVGNKKPDIIRAMFDAAYSDVSKHVVFDTNRGWTGLLEVLLDLYPDTKIVCTVRSIHEILNSFEHLYRINKHNLYNSSATVYNNYPASTVYARCDALMRQDGVVGHPLACINQAVMSPFSDRLLIVDYNDLVTDTANTVTKVYDFLGLERYKHDYEALKSFDTDNIDQNTGLNGLHVVRETVLRDNKQNIIPLDIINQFSGSELWRHIQK